MYRNSRLQMFSKFHNINIKTTVYKKARNFIKKRLQHKLFPVNIAKYFWWHLWHWLKIYQETQIALLNQFNTKSEVFH